jgi:hypothetical protein
MAYGLRLTTTAGSFTAGRRPFVTSWIGGIPHSLYLMKRDHPNHIPYLHFLICFGCKTFHVGLVIATHATKSTLIEPSLSRFLFSSTTILGEK